MRLLYADQWRKLWARPFEILGLCLIVFVVFTAFFAIRTAGDRLQDPIEAYYDQQNVEDFHISLGMLDFNHLSGAQRWDVYLTTQAYLHGFVPPNENDPLQMNAFNGFMLDVIYDYPDLIERLYNAMIQRVATRYDFAYETSYHVDWNDEDKTVRLITLNDTINKPYLIDNGGALPEDGEVAVFEAYANANGLAIGDTLAFDEVELTISGFIYSPQFTMPALKFDSLSYNPNTQTVGVTTLSSLLTLREPFKVYYQAKGEFPVDEEGFDVYAVMQTDLQRLGRNMRLVETVVPQQYNVRVWAIVQESRLTASAIEATLGVFVVLSATVTLWLVKHRIEQERELLVTLNRLGYAKRELAVSLLPIATSLSLTIALSVTIGLALSMWVHGWYVARYVMPHAPFTMPWTTILWAGIVPMLVLHVYAFCIAISALKRRGHDRLTPGWLRVKRLGRLAFQGTLYLGIATLFLFGRYGQGVVDALIDDTLRGKHYDRMAYLYQHETAPPEEGEPFLYGSVRLVSTNDGFHRDAIYAQAYGLDESVTRWKITDDQHVALQDGVFVSRQFARIHAVSTGDEVVFEGRGQQGKRITLTVAGIADEAVESAVYFYRDDLREALGFTETTTVHNGLLLVGDESVGEARAWRVVDPRVIAAEMDGLFRSTMRVIDVTMVLASLTAAFMFVYVVRDGLVRQMDVFVTLKALGYRASESYRRFLGTAFIVLLGAFWLAHLVARALMTLTLRAFENILGIVHVFTTPWLIFSLSYVGLTLLFVGVTILVHHAFFRRPLSELLKKV